MANCQDLDPESHAVLQAVDAAGYRKPPRAHPSATGVARISPDSAAGAAGVPKGDVRALLDDLSENGFLVFDRETGRIHRGSGCSCVDELDPVRQPVGCRGTTQAMTKEEPEKFPGKKPRENAHDGARDVRGGWVEADRVAGLIGAPQITSAQKKRNAIADKRPEDLTAFDLAAIFERRVRDSRPGQTPDPGTASSLRSHIARWMRSPDHPTRPGSGLSPVLVLGMIESFVADPRHFRQGTPPWRTFISIREMLAQKAINRGVGSSAPDDEDWDAWKSRKQAEHDASYSTTPSRPGDEDWDEWKARKAAEYHQSGELT